MTKRRSALANIAHRALIRLCAVPCRAGLMNPYPGSGPNLSQSWPVDELGT